MTKRTFRKFSLHCLQIDIHPSAVLRRKDLNVAFTIRTCRRMLFLLGRLELNTLNLFRKNGSMMFIGLI